MKTKIFCAVISSALLLASLPLFAQDANPRDQLLQFTAQLQKSPGDVALREKIIALALTLDPKPVEPDAAILEEGAAAYIFKNAKSASDFSDAVGHYKKALLLAPWFAEDYFNCGVAQESAGLNKEAIVSFNLYLLAAPNAADAVAVKRRVGGLQFVVQKAEDEAKAQQDKVARQRADEEAAAARASQERQAARAREQAEENAFASSPFGRFAKSLDGGVWRETHNSGVNFNGSKYHDSENIYHSYLSMSGRSIGYSTYIKAVDGNYLKHYVHVDYDPSIPPIWTTPLTSHQFSMPTYAMPHGSLSSSYNNFTISDDGQTITEDMVMFYPGGSTKETATFVRFK